MIRLFFAAVLLTAMTVLSSCQKDDVEPGQGSGHHKVVADTGDEDGKPIPPPHGSHGGGN